MLALLCYCTYMTNTEAPAVSYLHPRRYTVAQMAALDAQRVALLSVPAGPVRLRRGQTISLNAAARTAGAL